MMPTPLVRAIVSIALMGCVAQSALAHDGDPFADVMAEHSGPKAWALELRGARTAAPPSADRDASASNNILKANAAPSGITERATDLVVRALSLVGVHYRHGGNTPDTGFDCSGMVRYVFQNAFGLDLPRRAEELSRVGAQVGRSDLKPGDLVFYNTLRRTFSHVGIYLGDNRFIHAPASGGAVRVEDMGQSYWSNRFNGARRVAE